jgi:hypothetical protein
MNELNKIKICMTVLKHNQDITHYELEKTQLIFYIYSPNINVMTIFNITITYLINGILKY